MKLGIPLPALSESKIINFGFGANTSLIILKAISVTSSVELELSSSTNSRMILTVLVLAVAVLEGFMSSPDAGHTVLISGYNKKLNVFNITGLLT